MTQNEREEAIKRIKGQLEKGYIDFSEIFDENEISVIRELIDRDGIQDAVYKDGIYVCPNCGMSTFPMVRYNLDHCLCCGQHIRWRGIIKA